MATFLINKENKTITETTLQGKHFHTTKATARDVLWIDSNMREADRLELERFYEESPREVLQKSFEDSVMAWTAYRPDGLPVAIWGVAKAGNGEQERRIGIPWMIGTDYISECYRDFLVFSKYYDCIMSRYFHLLANAVDAEYAGAHRWLNWLGYSDGPVVKSMKGFDFIVMYKDTSDVR